MQAEGKQTERECDAEKERRRKKKYRDSGVVFLKDGREASQRYSIYPLHNPFIYFMFKLTEYRLIVAI